MRIFKNSYLIFLFLFLSSTILFGCNSEEDKKIEVSEKQVAISFFDAIYNEKDLNITLSLSSTNFKKELKRYRTVNNIAKRLFQMRFDSVSLHTSAIKTQVIDEYNVQVTMTVLFTGKRDGKTYKDYRRIILIKEDNVWLIDKLLKQK